MPLQKTICSRTVWARAPCRALHCRSLWLIFTSILLLICLQRAVFIPSLVHEFKVDQDYPHFHREQGGLWKAQAPSIEWSLGNRVMSGQKSVLGHSSAINQQRSHRPLVWHFCVSTSLTRKEEVMCRQRCAILTHCFPCFSDKITKPIEEQKVYFSSQLQGTVCHGEACWRLVISCPMLGSRTRWMVVLRSTPL